MCGIVGVARLRPRIVPRHRAVPRADARHDGPPRPRRRRRPGSSPDGRVGLGHRRLSIIDLVDGRQSADGQRGRHRCGSSSTARSTTTPRSARELEALGGHRWKTDHSDTEVILHAFEQWGIDCLHRFRGMFAFALWDARSTRAVAGARPHRHQAALLQRPPRPADLRVRDQGAARRSRSSRARSTRTALYHYLSFLTTPAPRHAVRRHPQAAAGHLAAGRRRTARSASSATGTCGTTSTPLDGRRRGRDRRAASSPSCAPRCRLRKVSDVPVGVFLSGGIDSSTNAALFSEGEARPVKTFSIGYDGDYDSYQNELHYARQMADAASAPSTTSCCLDAGRSARLPAAHGAAAGRADRRSGLRAALLRLEAGARQRRHRLPGRRRRRRAVLRLSDLAARRCELQQLDDLPVPRVLKRLALAGLRRRRQRTRGTVRVRCAAAAPGSRCSGAAPKRSPTREKQRLLSPRLRRGSAASRSWDAIAPIRERFEDTRVGARRTCNWMTYVDLNLRLPELLLMRVDKMSMGVCARGPRAVPRSQVRRAGDEHPDGAQDEGRHAEAHPEEGGARPHPRRADRPAEAGLRRAGLRMVLRRARRPTSAASWTTSAARPISSIVAPWPSSPSRSRDRSCGIC